MTPPKRKKKQERFAMKKTPKSVKAWAIRRKSDGDICEKLFETELLAIVACSRLDGKLYHVVEVLITPIKKQRRGK